MTTCVDVISLRVSRVDHVPCIASLPSSEAGRMGDDFKCDHCGFRIDSSAGLCGHCRTGYFRFDPIRPSQLSPRPVSDRISATESSSMSAAAGTIGAIVVVALLIAMCAGG